MRLALYQGDITRLHVDAIVNAANESLQAGGGVDGAIHAAAGPGLARELRKWRNCPTGQVRLTGAHGLPCKEIIHAVGPRWEGGEAGEPDLLQKTYQAALETAQKTGARTVAFPCISTGAFGYPAREAARVAVDTCEDWVLNHDTPEQVVFCTFMPRDTNIYRDLGIRDHPDPDSLLRPHQEDLL